MYLKKICIILFILLSLSSICFARATLPFSKGIAVNDTLTVISVNLFGPAFYAGIRPGDQLLDTTKELLYQDAPYSASELVKKDTEIYNCLITPKQLQRSTEQSIFLLPANSLTIQKVYDSIQSDLELKKILPLKSLDTDWGILYTSGELNLENPHLLDYIVTNNQPSSIRLKTVLFFTSEEFNTFQLFHMDINFEEKINKTWQKVPSSGILEQEIITKLMKAREL